MLLNIEEQRDLKKALLGFIERVAKGDNATIHETQLLPEIIRLTAELFALL